MSNFDDNPFGEPAVDNPFADPAVQQAARIAPKSNILEEYNPFEDDNPHTTIPIGQQQQPQQQPFPAYNQNSQTNSAYGKQAPQISTEELQRRQEELERKAQDLERREEQLRNNAAGIRRNNWPPLPEQCCFQPCFYQDINVEIPPEFQRIVRHLYYLWGFYALVLCCNALVALLLVLFHGTDYIGHFTLGLIYGTLFTPASFMCWYRPAYKAFRSDSSFNFMVFFLIFFFQFLMLILQSIGITGSGYCGFLTAIRQFNGTLSGIFTGVLALAVATSFAICAAGSFLLLTKVHAIYRSSDKVSMDKAQAEFANEFMRNQGVRRAAATAAQAAMSSQFNNQAQNANRY
ncbi:secretory carrier-associated membrane protein 2 [Contarinia nasturtii]|uniref:secretory carrier-associated membrane protein 2 n=1 Tax=Contarinia nasturtii TaxID=265458 RepID=UPI0012D4793C|nr:secretory carrier-associated membrane protein 2 [Contarinia nasturtii]